MMIATSEFLAKREERRLQGVQRSWKAAHLLHKKSRHQLSNLKRARKFVSENATIKQHVSAGKPVDTQMMRSYSNWLNQHWIQDTPCRPAHDQGNGKVHTDHVELLFEVKQFMSKHDINIKHMRGIINVLEHLTG
jgi:hypothetical protein